MNIVVNEKSISHLLVDVVSLIWKSPKFVCIYARKYDDDDQVDDNIDGSQSYEHPSEGRSNNSMM